MLVAIPGACGYKADSLATIDALQAGQAVRTSSEKKCDWAYKPCFEVLGRAPSATLTWTPAHKKQEHVCVLRLGSGGFLSKQDLYGNFAADQFVKDALEVHRVDAKQTRNAEKPQQRQRAIHSDEVPRWCRMPSSRDG